jgi:hypothetical protein
VTTFYTYLQVTRWLIKINGLRIVRDRNEVISPAAAPQQTQAHPAEVRLLSMSVPAGETAAGV